MPAHRSIRPLLIALGLLVAAKAHAITPFVPLEDRRVIQVTADYFGDHESREARPSAPFGYFEERDFTAIATDEEQEGDCVARAAQISTIIDSIGYMGFTGGAEGGWSGPPEGTWSAISLARIRFRLLSCTEYTLQVVVDPGDCPTLGATCTNARLEGLNGLSYQEYFNATVTVEGRLAPGEYALEGRSGLTSSEPSAGGGAYTLIWNCHTCPWSIILEHPHDKKAPPGSDPTLVASASVPTEHMSYQWRRNLVPLVDGGAIASGATLASGGRLTSAGRLTPMIDGDHITGSRTPTLTIHNMSAADSGYYDVVFTDSSNVDSVIVEPSRLAHLELDTVTGVEPRSGSAPRTFALSPAAPNPFARSTSFRYEAPTSMRVRMVIYNVAGARVRLLMDEVVSGARTVAWDGTVESGARAPAGIYYLRVEAGASRESRKVVLLR
jgi:hypothetical protein